MSDQPSWERLPADPVGFFGLPEKFDRRDLKRAYRDLVRRFKPDRAPEEFRRIRAAYEELERSLRTSAPAARPSSGDAGDAGDAGSEAGAADATAHEAVVGALARGEHDEFWRSLLDALDRFPASDRLLRTLHEAYQEPTSVSPELVHEIAARRPQSEILVDAIPLWNALLQTTPPKVVIETFEGVAAGVDPAEHGLLLLRLYLVRRLLLVGDPGWLEEQMEILWAASEEIPDPFRSRVEGFRLLLSYRRVRRAFLSRVPAAAELDRRFALYTERPPARFWPHFAQYLGHLRTQPGVLHELGSSTAAEAEPARALLHWMVEAARERIGNPGSLGRETARTARVRQTVEELLEAVRGEGPRAWRFQWWRSLAHRWLRIAILALIALGLLSIPVVTAQEDTVHWGGWFRSLFLFSMLAGAVLLWARRYLGDAWQGAFLGDVVSQRLRTELYRQVMAPRAHQLLSAEGISPDELSHYLDLIPQSDHWAVVWLVVGLQDDPVAQIQSFPSS